MTISATPISFFITALGVVILAISPTSSSTHCSTAQSSNSLPRYLTTSRTMFLSFISITLFVKAISAVCYKTDGSLISDTEYVPCNSITGTISMCCGTNRGSSSPYTADTCLSNGLCQNIFTNLTTNKPDINYWREGCSDKNWNNQTCLSDICLSVSINSLHSPMSR